MHRMSLYHFTNEKMLNKFFEKYTKYLAIFNKYNFTQVLTYRNVSPRSVVVSVTRDGPLSIFQTVRKFLDFIRSYLPPREGAFIENAIIRRGDRPRVIHVDPGLSERKIPLKKSFGGSFR